MNGDLSFLPQDELKVDDIMFKDGDESWRDMKNVVSNRMSIEELLCSDGLNLSLGEYWRVSSGDVDWKKKETQRRGEGGGICTHGCPTEPLQMTPLHKCWTLEY